MNRDYETDGTYLPKAVDQALTNLEEELFSIVLEDSNAYRRTVARDKLKEALLTWYKEAQSKA